MRSAFRGVLEWSHEGNPLTTASNEACKMYDASLSQLVGWYNDPNIGGIESTVNKMLNNDPDFVMGHCLKLGLDLLGTGFNPQKNEKFKAEIDQLNQLANNQKKLSAREAKHVIALNKWASGDLIAATNVWEQILIENPTDMHAIKMGHDAYFYLGRQAELRDSIARVLPFWQSSSIPLKNYLHGMYAFGLEETNFYDKAIKEAKLALERNPKDGWATHALGHVYEMTGETALGMQMYESTKSNWKVCDMLSCHNFWHYALYFIENGDYERAFEIYSKDIEPKSLAQDFILNFVDCNSFLYRLELFEGKKRTENYVKVYEACKSHFDDHVLGFNDAHYMMGCIGAGKMADAQEIVASLDKQSPTYEVTYALLQGMLCFEREQYAQSVEWLLPIKYRLVKIGGSDAQRDVFNQLLIMAAIKSPNDHHRKLCEHLINERNQFKEVSPLNSLLIEKLNK